MKNIKVDELTIEGVVYVPKENINLKEAEKFEGMPYVMIRTYSAGVHCGYLKERVGKECILIDSIRIWNWSGAASLSQLAMEGTKNKDNNCKFGMPISTELILTESIEIITMTEKAKNSIKSILSWKN